MNVRSIRALASLPVLSVTDQLWLIVSNVWKTRIAFQQVSVAAMRIGPPPPTAQSILGCAIANVRLAARDQDQLTVICAEKTPIATQPPANVAASTSTAGRSAQCTLGSATAAARSVTRMNAWHVGQMPRSLTVRVPVSSAMRVGAARTIEGPVQSGVLGVLDQRLMTVFSVLTTPTGSKESVSVLVIGMTWVTATSIRAPVL
jgi:hypothetical protein